MTRRGKKKVYQSSSLSPSNQPSPPSKSPSSNKSSQQDDLDPDKMKPTNKAASMDHNTPENTSRENGKRSLSDNLPDRSDLSASNQPSPPSSSNNSPTSGHPVKLYSAQGDSEARCLSQVQAWLQSHKMLLNDRFIYQLFTQRFDVHLPNLRFLFPLSTCHRFISSIHLIVLQVQKNGLFVLMNQNHDDLKKPYSVLGGKIATLFGCNQGETPDKSFSDALDREIREETNSVFTVNDFDLKTGQAVFHVTKSRQLLVFYLPDDNAEKNISAKIQRVNENRKKISTNAPEAGIDYMSKLDKLRWNLVRENRSLLKLGNDELKKIELLKKIEQLQDAVTKVLLKYKGSWPDYFSFSIHKFHEYCHGFWVSPWHPKQCDKRHHFAEQEESSAFPKLSGSQLDSVQDHLYSFDFSFEKPATLGFFQSTIQNLPTTLEFPPGLQKIKSKEDVLRFLDELRKKEDSGLIEFLKNHQCKPNNKKQ